MHCLLVVCVSVCSMFGGMYVRVLFVSVMQRESREWRHHGVYYVVCGTACLHCVIALILI